MTTARKLVEGVRANGDAALVELAVQLKLRFRNFALARLPASEADDYLQTLFLESVTAIRSTRLRTPDALWIFLFGLAKHLMQTNIRRRRVYRARVVSIETAHQQGDIKTSRRIKTNKNVIMPIDSAASHTDRAVILRELRRTLGRALDQLPPLSRSLIERLYLRDQPRRVIQMEMRLSAGQYYARHRRAMLRLRRDAEDLRRAA